MKQILLASASLRRAELLAQLGVEFVVAPADIDERCYAGESALAYVRRMALTKAAIGGRRNPAAAANGVLAADTIVVCGAASYSPSALADRGKGLAGGRILGKPADERQAVDMLSTLSNRTHQVYTALAVSAGVQQGFACVCTDVSFRSVSSQEARAYWDTGEPADKAGGYGIQGAGSKFVNKIYGSYTNVVGLPLFETACILRALQLLD